MSILILLLALALALRLFAIDSRGLWSDEAYRVLAARQPTLFDTLHAAWAQPPSAPLYWVALHVWVGLFGHGDVAVRLFSVFPSVGACVAAYGLGRMVGGALTGLLSALLLAVSPFAVETGQEATMYAWSTLLAAGALWAGLRWLKTGRGVGFYIVFATLLLYTHYMGVLLLLELLAAGLIWRARSRSGGEGDREVIVRGPDWAKAHGLIALLWSPWAVAMGIRLAERANEYSHLQHRAGLDDLYGLAINMGVAPSAAATWPTWQINLALVIGGCLLLFALFLPRPHGQRHILWILAALPSAFVLVIVGVSAITGAWLVQPRFITLVLPVALVVVAAGVPFSWLKHGLKPSRMQAILGTLGALLMVGWLIFQLKGVRSFYTNPVHGRDGVRETAAWLNKERRPGDLVVANQALLLWPLAQYHDGPLDGLPESADVRDGYGLWPFPDQVELPQAQFQALSQKAAQANAAQIWLVYLPAVDQHGILLNQMRQHYRLVEERPNAFADVYLFAGK